MAYEKMAHEALEYYPCRYGTSKTLFRGPKRRLDVPFIAMLGGSECYGRFVRRPFPDLVEASIGIPCVNLGQMNGGVDVFAGDNAVATLSRDALVTVVQILPAHNLSNRFYHVHPRRNDRFLKPTALMETLFQEVDFGEFHFTRHMLVTLKAVSPDKFRMIMQELKAAWTARMRLLLSRMPGRKVLLWLPDESDRAADRELGAEPLFISASMVEDLRPLVDTIVTYHAAQTRARAGTTGMVVSELELPVAQELLPPACHAEIAAALTGAIRALVR
jgi:hypothetical protein